MPKPKECPNCKTELIEVRKVFDPDRARMFERKGLESTHGDFFYDYPKEIVEPGMKKIYHEYRFVCKACKKEWTYDTLNRFFEEVPNDSQFYYPIIPRLKMRSL